MALELLGTAMEMLVVDVETMHGSSLCLSMMEKTREANLRINTRAAGSFMTPGHDSHYGIRSHTYEREC
jgi:hypothetical protein